MILKPNLVYYLLLIFGILLIILILITINKRKNNVQEGFQTKYELPSEILLINMDSRTDRLKSFEESFNNSDCSKHGLSFTRIPAVIGKDQDWKNGLLTPEATKEMEKTVQTGKRKGHESLSIGAIGCYLSHLKAMEYIVKQNKPMIICEDDIKLPNNFYEKMKSGLGLLPPGKPIILLYHVICNSWVGTKLKCTELEANFFKVYNFWSLACYYITPETANIILENSKPLAVQIDAHLSELVEQNKLDIYAYPIANTDGNLGTDIQIAIAE